MIIPIIGIIMVDQYHPEDLVEDLIVTTKCKKTSGNLVYKKKENKLQRSNARQRETNGGKLK